MSDEITRSEAVRRYLRGEITYQEMRAVEDRYHPLVDQASTRVAEPIWPVPSVLEQAMKGAVDHWREEARWWRTRCWIASGFGLIGWLGWATALFVWLVPK